MFCPKCGKEVEEDAKFCKHCGYEFVEEKEETKKVDEKGRYIDEEGFVRKTRNGIGILLWVIAGIIGRISWQLPSEFDVVALCLWPVIAYLPYLGIKMYSSHDIETWKHSPHVKLWIYVGCLLAGLVGIIVYYYFKGKERKYLAKTHI
jgi:hypothetical protein